MKSIDLYCPKCGAEAIMRHENSLLAEFGKAVVRLDANTGLIEIMTAGYPIECDYCRREKNIKIVMKVRHRCEVCGGVGGHLYPCDDGVSIRTCIDCKGKGYTLTDQKEVCNGNHG